MGWLRLVFHAFLVVTWRGGFKSHRALRNETIASPILLGHVPKEASDLIDGPDPQESEVFDLLEPLKLTVIRFVLGSMSCLSGGFFIWVGLHNFTPSRMFTAAILVACGLFSIALSLRTWGLDPLRVSSALASPGRVEVFSILGHRSYSSADDRVCVYFYFSTSGNTASNTLIVLGKDLNSRAIILTNQRNAIAMLKLWQSERTPITS